MKEYLINSKNGKINILEGDDVDNCKGIILHLHGVGSHFQYVYNSCDDLRVKDKFFISHGYKTFAFEFHGHGKSEGSLHVIHDFNNLVIDLENVIDMIEKKYINKNIFIIAESMGCAVAIKYIALRIHNIKGLILLSPICGINYSQKPNYCFERLLSYTSYVFPLLQYTIGSSIAQQSTTNKEYLKSKIDAYPLCTLREVINTCMLIPKLGHLINCPTYILYGENDNIICIDSIETFYYNINSDKIKQVIKNKNHYLLIPSSDNEKHFFNFIDKNGKIAINNPVLILNMIVDWIDSHN